MLLKCSYAGCEKVSKLTRGLCSTHYKRLVRTGDPSTVRPPGKPGSSRKHPMYGAFAAMLNRCHNPNNSSYGRYGARGISVCDRWRFGEEGEIGFQCFLADMGERPQGKTLDRKNPLGNYGPENCRWATAVEQRANISADGDARTRAAISKAKLAYWEAWRQRSSP